MPVVLRGRLRHDRHFTFRTAATGGDETAVTLLTSRVGGALASTSARLVAKGPWLQILVDDAWLPELEADLAELQHADSLVLPKTWCWPDRQMALTVVADDLWFRPLFRLYFFLILLSLQPWRTLVFSRSSPHVPFYRICCCSPLYARFRSLG